MTDITELAQSLKAAAEKATSGEWAVQFGDEVYVTNDDVGYEQVAIATLDASDADYIALANPANILALVEALEKAQGMEAYWKTQCRGITDHCEELQARIAELESRTVKMPVPYAYLRENDGQIQISIGAERPSDRSGGYATPWFAIYTAAGIKVEAE